MIRRNTEVMRQVESKQEELERDGAVYQESVERMTQHVELVEALEKTCGHNKALEEERRKVKILRRQSRLLVTLTPLLVTIIQLFRIFFVPGLSRHLESLV